MVGGGYAQNFQKGEEAADKGDFATALREWRPLAEQGNADAQNNLGAMYDKGQGVPQDYKEAFNWYRKSAEQGDAEARRKHVPGTRPLKTLDFLVGYSSLLFHA